ncbi:hypothetical protein niasHT_018731 [Heterodera trifolii]|uniref:DNA-directed DNA polymerase n=1 Tax=Heterodera trifolii TaxID=157864 RepID=A0ABD2LCV5_9BILA
MSSDDEMPPVLNGPYTPMRDGDEPFEDAPPIVEVINHFPNELVLEEAKGKNDHVIKERLNLEEFNGEHFKCLDAAQAESGRFKAYRFLGRFMLDYIWNADYPENVLKSLFLMCLSYALKGASAMNITANHLIFLLTSRHLDYEIAVHFKNFKKIDDKMAETILTRFEIVDQSNKSKERPSLLEESFVIDITAIDSGGKRQKMAGKGGRRRDFNVPYDLLEGATYELENNDAYCLFRAFEFLRMKHVLPQQRFSEYKRDDEQQLNNVTSLFRECDIQMGLQFYSIEEYGNKIQEYYNEMHPGMFRLFCFDTFGKMKPVWKSTMTDYRHELCVLYTDGDDGAVGHYDAIKSIGKIFGSKNYCFGCEVPYFQQNRHNSSCKWKCHNCQRVGNGFRGNCKNFDDNFFESCLGCNKTFQSKECYDHHKKITPCKVKKGKETKTIERCICNTSKRCNACGVIYRPELQDKKNGHVCDHKFCRACGGFHAKRECYIPYRPKVKKEKRFIFFDFECTTNFQPDPNLAKFKHQVNFCYAHVTCTRCIQNGTWNDELDRACAICGPMRFYSWAPFYYDNTAVDRAFRVDDPLAAFTKWLLNFESETLHIETGETRKRKRGGKKNNNAAHFIDEEAEDDVSDDNDAENNYMLGYDEEGEKPVSVTTYAYAHAGSRYDHILIFGEMLRMGVRPKLVRQGNHLLEMSTNKRGTITRTVFRDSYKLIPIKLASFVKTFGLSIEGVENKKYFPHGFNKAENYGNVLDNLPPIESYHPGSMLPDDRKALESWYEENRETRFDLREVIADYCKTDVQILAHGLIKMRELFTQKTGADITDSITIPSACMRFFVTLAHFGNERIAIVPHLGYEKRGKQSTIARKYLKWRAVEEERENGYTLRHVESPGGEFKFGNYSLDGMVERADADKNLAIEVNGCYWHACPHCFPEDDAIVGGGETAGAIRARDEKRTRAIAREFEVEIVWECQLHRMLEDDPAMKAFFDNTPDSGPIEFHDAFFGGRTGPEWLGASVVDNPERTIKIKDFNSLYPSRNMYTKYPVGHPVSINFNKDVNWRKPSDIVGDDGEPLEGIIKCFVVPPRHCLFDIPVLPLRMNNRTLFPLCRKCSELYPNGLVDPEYNCPHFEDHERGFSTTVCHIELEPALRAGYRVTRLYWVNVWRYCGDWSDSLFHRYLERFLKIKFEANGYPADCLDQSVSEEKQQRRKEEFVEKTWTGDKVRLDPANIKPNPGLRYLAKLCLNSLWGRFALRNRLTVTEIVGNNCDLSMLLNNEKIDISSLDQLTDKFWMVCYKTKDEHVVEHDTSNVVIALWTTAAARVHLLESLQKVLKPEPGVDRFDTRNLYMDTDSIFSDFKTEIGDPLPSGKHLGELTDEYPNEKIMEYVCAGPKAYGIWYKDKDGVDKYKLKLRGITLDSNACQRMNFDRMKEMVIKKWGTPDNNVRFDYPTRNFRITNKGDIFTVPLTKQFNPTVNKGVIRDNGLKIVPFGYSSYEYCKPRNPYDCICKKE